MQSLNYHRQYLWIFFYMFFVLLWVALIADCIYVGSSSSGSGFALRTPRFLNVVFVFIFAAISALLQNQWPKFLLKPDLLKVDNKYWKKKFIKVRTRRKIRKNVKKHKYVTFFTVHAIANFIGLIPMITLVVLGLCGILDTARTQGTILSLAFFLTAASIKYLAWYITSIASRITIFRGVKRLNMFKN